VITGGGEREGETGGGGVGERERGGLWEREREREAVSESLLLSVCPRNSGDRESRERSREKRQWQPASLNLLLALSSGLWQRVCLIACASLALVSRCLRL